ncbi:MAG: hypothetical protein WKG03_08890 [Telluria sp.]
MNVQLTDKMGFGKYAGRIYGDILRIDPSYLVWLREKKAEQGHHAFFCDDFHGPLDAAIRADSQLKRKYRTWAETRPSASASAMAQEVAEKVRPKHVPLAPEEAYSEGWGAF